MSTLYATVAALVLLSVNLVAEAGRIGGTCDDATPCNINNAYCLKNSACQFGICQCKAGYAVLTGTNANCYAANVRLGSSCLDTALCGQNAECNPYACRCKSGYRALADGINCLKGTVALGGTCNATITPSQCGDNAVCTNNVCACSSGFVPVTDNAYSCRYPTFGESCTSNCDTSLGLLCFNGQCQCNNGQTWQFVANGLGAMFSRCVSFAALFNRGYGQSCHTHQATEACGSISNERLCSPGLVCKECPEDASTCIRKCLIDSDRTFCLSAPCQNGGACTDTVAGYTCSCPAGWTGTNCETANVRGLIGDSCSLNGLLPCTASNSFCLKNSVCQLGTCTCKDGYVSSSSNRAACYPANVKLYIECNITEQCGSNAACSYGICQCPPYYREDAAGINCLEGYVAINAACSVNSECGSNALCSAGKCICRSGYVPLPGNIGCRNLTNGETCDVDIEPCDTDIGLHCDPLTFTCVCGSGQVWRNVTYGTRPARMACIASTAIFTRTFGQTCHDLPPFSTHPCGQSVIQKACSSGLVCKECPEDTGSCIRKCLSESAFQLAPAYD